MPLQKPGSTLETQILPEKSLAYSERSAGVSLVYWNDFKNTTVTEEYHRKHSLPQSAWLFIKMQAHMVTIIKATFFSY